MPFLLEADADDIFETVVNAVQDAAPKWRWEPTGMDEKRKRFEGIGLRLTGHRTYLATRAMGTEIPLMVEIYPMIPAAEDPANYRPEIRPLLHLKSLLPPVQYEVREKGEQDEEPVWVKLDQVEVYTRKATELDHSEEMFEALVGQMALQQCGGIFECMFRGPQLVEGDTYQTEEGDSVQWSC